MIFYVLIFIVFIAEIIIASAVILNLLKLDKTVLCYDEFLTEIKPKIKDILSISRKISEQFVELAPIIVKKIKSFFVNIIKDQLKNILAGLTFWAVKTEIENRL